MRRLAACVLALCLAGCSTAQVEKFQTASANFQNVVRAINADIAAAAPVVASGCGQLQTAAMLIRPFVQSSDNATKYFEAANGALGAYCQNVPTDVRSTVTAVFKAVQAAEAGYEQVSARK